MFHYLVLHIFILTIILFSSIDIKEDLQHLAIVLDEILLIFRDCLFAFLVNFLALSIMFITIEQFLFIGSTTATINMRVVIRKSCSIVMVFVVLFNEAVITYSEIIRWEACIAEISSLRDIIHADI